MNEKSGNELGPIFIGGPDRCGKTTMQAFLVSHPSISIPHVGSNMWTYFYGQFGELNEVDNFERCLEAMLAYKHVRFLQPDSERIRREFWQGAPTYARLFALFQQHHAERAGKPRWGVQTGLIERYADQVFAAYPTAKMIHMLRDPRDRYQASRTLWPDGKGRAGGAAARWLYSLLLARRNLKKYPGRYKIVQFEALVRDPEGAVSEVCQFIGEEFVPDMLTMSGAPERRDKLRRRASLETGPSPLSEEFIGIYRGAIPKFEVAFMQHVAGAQMSAFGYSLDPIGFSPRERIRYAGYEWPSNLLRMIAWLSVEGLQHHFPSLFGRKPDPRLIVKRRRQQRRQSQGRKRTPSKSQQPGTPVHKVRDYPPQQRPIFIGGPERAGKTYLRLMLAAHPHIALTRRTNMWTHYYGAFGDLGRDRNIERCLRAMMERKHIRALDPDLDHIRREFWQGPRTYGHLFALFHEQFAERQGKARWGDQTELIERCADPIFAAYPQARMIQLIRDPRDRYQAIRAREPQASGRLGKATSKWLYSEALGRQNQQSFPDNYLVLRYESMVSHPEETLRDVCQFLGEEFDRTMVALANEPRFWQSQETPLGLGDSPLSTEFIGRYREGLSALEIAFVQALAGPRMRAYGYGLEPTRFSNAEKFRFYLGTWGPNVAQMIGWRALQTVRTRLTTWDAHEAGIVRRALVGTAG